MQSLSERARELFPSVLLTVLSIVQALALELLWGRVHEAPFLRAGGWLGQWFYTLALVFAVSMGASFSIFRRARRDPANRGFFSTVEPAQLRDFAPGIAASIGLVLLGVLLHATKTERWLALIAVLGAGAALSQQLLILHRFWKHSILAADPSEESH